MARYQVSRRPVVPIPASDPDDYPLVRGEIAMWRAVLAQALTDAVSKSPRFEERKPIRDAKKWLGERSADFDEVCDMAMLDPHVVHKQCRNALTTGWVLRKPTGECWRVQERLAREAAMKAAKNESYEDYNE